MEHLKRYLFSLIPIAFLGGAFVLAYIFAMGTEGADNLLFYSMIGAAVGFVIHYTYLNDSEIHTFLAVLCWIGFGLFALAGLLLCAAAAHSQNMYEESLLSAHVTIGALGATALTIIYCYIVSALGFGEDHAFIVRMVVPSVLFIGGVIGFGFFKSYDFGTIEMIAHIMGFAPVVVVIGASILFAKMDLYGNYSEGRDSGSDGYSGGRRSYSSGSSDDGPSKDSIRYALIGLSASYNIGCTVTVTITDAVVFDDSISIETEITTKHAPYGTEDEGGAQVGAENALRKKANERLRSIGAHYSF